MKSIQALREQRAAKGKELHDLVNKDGDFGESEQKIYDDGMAEVARIDASIKRIEEVNARLAEETQEEAVLEAAERTQRNTGANTSVFQKWLRGGDNALNTADWEKVRAAQTTTEDDKGGYTVDSEIAKRVIDKLKAYGGMRSLATVITTDGGNKLFFPTSDGTAEEGEIIAENGSATDEDITFGTVSLEAYKYSSKVVTVPIELLQDSGIDIESFVQNRLITRLGRITNKHFVLGTGTNQPRGVQVAAEIGVTAANGAGLTTAVDYDTLVKLQHSIDPAYRNGKSNWLFNDNTLAGLRTIKDDSGRPIFVPGYEVGPSGGAPDMLLGRPIEINQDMPNLAAGKKGVLFGDFSGYMIRDVMGVTLHRFTDSAYTKRGQVGFLAWQRCGGNLIDGSAVRALKQAAS